MTQRRHHASNRRLSRARLAALFMTTLVAGVPFAHGQFGFTDINPSRSNLADVNGGTGGRVNGLAVKWADPATYYAASEWGGIYRTTDSGETWHRLDGHNPNATWDVEVNPANVNRVYATSLYDGRVNSFAGINISTDGGETWTHPSTALPPTNLCNTSAAQTEPSAFGISIDPLAPTNVYVGTNCGLAVSSDAGTAWTYRSTLTGYLATEIIDVVAHHDGIVDVCGYFGHQRSIDYGATWTGLDGDIPGGTCSIDASPDDPDVLFVTVGTDIYESDDGGVTWVNLGTPDEARQGRIPFVAVNDRSGDAFDLWFGDIRLYRGSCTSNPDPGGTHCPAAWLDQDPPDIPPPGWELAILGGHWDVGDIVFDPGATVDACPTIFSSDGGVYINFALEAVCHQPQWGQPTTTPHGLWLWTLSGTNFPDAGVEGLYFGCQDVGTFGTILGPANPVPWNNKDCCDSFDFTSDYGPAVYTQCCFSPGRANRLYAGLPGLTFSGELDGYPVDGLIPGFRFPDVLDQFGEFFLVLITHDCTPGVRGCPGTNGGTGGIHLGVVGNPMLWIELPTLGTKPPTGGDFPACAVKTSASPALNVYVQSGRCDGIGHDLLWRWTDAGGGDWEELALPEGGISLFDVDPGNPNRLIAVNLPSSGDPRVIFSEDGGANWSHLAQLDPLMTGDGDYHYINTLGPRSSSRFGGYPQPSLVAFDPEDPNILVAGGRDSGVFLSTDGGEDWGLVTDPGSTGGSVPHLPQPWFVYFDHEPFPWVNMYVGTRGRGVWRVTFQLPPIADANGPYETLEGTDVTLDGTGSYDPGGSSLTYEWDFDDDGLFDDATGATPDFDPIGDGVGQDGVYTVRLRVTNESNLSDTDETTVTVLNVAPSVALASDSPQAENSPLIVTAMVTDPGWLDVLTATINWGDGTSGDMTVTSTDNSRPDAVYIFSAVHIYGDNGDFTATVCGHDDDTSTCATIELTILNVPPTTEIDETGVVAGCGGSAFIAHAGDDVSFSGRATDPGSDDLTLTWIWGDGTPDNVTVSLVNPPNPDPFPSPSIQPRDVLDLQTHAFADACQYTVRFLADDDDGGSGEDETVVVIVGNAEVIRSAGYWYNQFRKLKFFTADELDCYLDIVNHLSAVFSEETDADSIADAKKLMHPAHSKGDIRVQFDRQLFAVWLNFANGAIEHDQLVDTDFDLAPDTELITFLCAAEAARLNPATPGSELEDLKDLLEAINLLDEAMQ